MNSNNSNKVPHFPEARRLVSQEAEALNAGGFKAAVAVMPHVTQAVFAPRDFQPIASQSTFSLPARGQLLGNPMFFPNKSMSHLDQYANTPFVDPLVPTKHTVIVDENKPKVYEGPLCPYNSFVTTKKPTVVMNHVKACLDNLVEDGLLDMDISDFKVTGRMYDSKRCEMSEFIAEVFTSEEDPSNTILEVRRTAGDGFVHNGLFSKINSHLASVGVIEAEPTSDFDSFPFMSMPSLSSLTLESDSDNESVQSVDDNAQLVQEIITALSGSCLYRNEYRAHVTTLCLRLNDTDFMTALSKVPKVVSILVKPLLEDFHDTCIIRNVLRVVASLLSMDSGSDSPIRSEIESIASMWKSNVIKNIGAMSVVFIKSQQITRLCDKCLAVLA